MKSGLERIVVAAGGRSAERDRSLLTGAHVTESLKRQGYDVVQADPARRRGLRKIRRADVVFLAVPGTYGEDGKLQGYLDTLDIRYTGSGVLASALGMHKPTSKRIMQEAGIRTLPFSVINADSDLESGVLRVVAEREGKFPLFVKPSSEGSSLGTGIVRTPQELRSKIEENRQAGYGEIMVEPYVRSRSFTVGLVQEGEKLVVLPVSEITSEGEYNDAESKLKVHPNKFICPADIPSDLHTEMQKLAVASHEAIGAHGISRVDFLVGDDGVSYVAEINTLPGLRTNGAFRLMAEKYGMTYDQLIESVLKTATTKPKYIP